MVMASDRHTPCLCGLANLAHLVSKVTLFREKKALCKIFLINFWLFTVKTKKKIWPMYYFVQLKTMPSENGRYICWLSRARWSRYIWGHFLFSFYRVCRDIPGKIQYMGHRFIGFKRNLRFIVRNFTRFCKICAYWKTPCFSIFWTP